MKVICISGKAQAGKDTYANFLAHELRVDGYKVVIMHYADILKFICRTYLNWDGEKDEYGRWLLQHVGTDVIRQRANDFFAYTLMSIIDNLRDFTGWDYVIIPDTRFKNELSITRYFCLPSVHIRVERPNFDNGLTAEQRAHESETALDDAPYDFLITNSGTLADLHDAAITTVADLTGAHQIIMEEFM